MSPQKKHWLSARLALATAICLASSATSDAGEPTSGDELRSLLSPAPATPVLLDPQSKHESVGITRLNRFVDLHQYDQEPAIRVNPPPHHSTPAFTITQRHEPVHGQSTEHAAEQSREQRFQQSNSASLIETDASEVKGKVRQNPLVVTLPPRLQHIHVASSQHPLSGALVMHESASLDPPSHDDVVDSWAVSMVDPSSQPMPINGGTGMLAMDQIGSHLPDSSQSLDTAPSHLPTTIAPSQDHLNAAIAQITESDNTEELTIDFAEAIRAESLPLLPSPTADAVAQSSPTVSASQDRTETATQPELESVVVTHVDIQPSPKTATVDRPLNDQLFAEASKQFGLDASTDDFPCEFVLQECPDEDGLSKAGADQQTLAMVESDNIASPEIQTRLQPGMDSQQPGDETSAPTLVQRFSSWTKRLGSESTPTKPVSTSRRSGGILNVWKHRTEN
ncbi:hypothetical protein LOC67_08140 [Stieleria sp. JC731]|uniref:hypothetical protein n=1 Tax=Pirellulaceae TaxID=2691357 RepID=UPI001E2A98C5|nr:hypothetical protein [Stieleria sp. JC731]MCC9600528.1 hypothetical protein [Stieleria sp. JC731]